VNHAAGGRSSACRGRRRTPRSAGGGSTAPAARPHPRPPGPRRSAARVGASLSRTPLALAARASSTSSSRSKVVSITTRVLVGLQQAAGGVQPVQAWHAHVHQHDVGRSLSGQLEAERLGDCRSASRASAGWSGGASQ
jgi:hypothetical protein